MSNLALKISDRFENRRVFFFSQYRLQLNYNSPGSSFSLQMIFDPDNPEHKELACVTHYHEVELFYNDQKILTGVVTNNGFRHAPSKQLAGLSGYSKPGLLQDCSIPPEAYPLQCDGLSLNQIVRKMTAIWVDGIHSAYGLKIKVDDAVQDRMNKVISKSTASETDTVFGYLNGLARQRDIIISHTPDGELLFTQSKTRSEPFMTIDTTIPDGMRGITTIELDYDGTGLHSHIYVKGKASKSGDNASDETIRNPYVVGTVYRPIVISQSSGDDNDTISAARRALGKELENIKVRITTDRWEVKNQMILPNSTISIRDPEIYLYNKKNWFVQSVSYEGTPEKTTATINCVLPECFNGDKVESVFRNINLHALDND